MATVFISYRRSDSAAEALLLRSALAGRLGTEAIFLDTASIDPGTVWPSHLRRSLAEATLVVAVIGADWLGSLDRNYRRRIDDENDWVRQELAEALASGKTVLPVCVCGAQMPSKEALPEPLQALSDRQALEIRQRYWDYDVRILLDLVAPEIQAEARSEPPSREPRGRAPRGGRSKLPSGGTAEAALRSELCRINPYKLFYFRSNRKLSYTALEEKTGIARATLRLLEKTSPGKGVLEISRFRTCEPSVLDLLERALGCEGRLEAGEDDDFLTQYMEFYRLYGGGGRSRIPSGATSRATHFEKRD